MDEILQAHHRSLALYDTEFQEIENVFTRLKAQREYLENARHSVKNLIAEEEYFLNYSPVDDETFADAINNENTAKTIVDVADNNSSSYLTDITATNQIVFGTFTDMTLIQAAIKYLRIAKKGQSTRQISEALLKGGYQTMAEDFTDTVRSTLKQYRAPKGHMIWIDNKWELKESVP